MKKELELYELILLFKFTSTEAETVEKIQAYKDFLTEKGSQVMVKNQGKRSLAYPIKNVETATAVQFVYLGNGELNKQLGVEIQRDEYVLRATTTKLMDESLSKLFA
jgi:ribosomal protein S6|tara:strand:- start:397 stop:717 length:321 start_codon:yes stop_codon:yes gene_type:complete